MKKLALRLLPLSALSFLSLPAQTPATEPASSPVVVQAAPAETAPAEPALAGERGGRMQRGERNANNPRRANFNPAEMQARMMDGLRQQMGVTNDDEWALISERITAIVELRRGQAVGAGAGMAFLAIAANGNGNNRGNRAAAFGGSPEQEALRAAVTDNLPDAEITARLAKLRESRKQNEAKLEAARENLRAVLTLKQEAVAVMLGLLN